MKVPRCRTYARQPASTSNLDEDEEDEMPPDPIDPWGGEDHSQENLQRVKEVIHSH